MAQSDRDVKSDPGHRREMGVVYVVLRCRDWIDRHPRTGWYVSFMVTLNFLLGLVQVFH